MVDDENRLINRRIRDVARAYRKRGYQVAVHPTEAELPPFLRDSEPDIVAQKDGDKVIVEVKTQSSLQGSNELVALAERIANEKDWRFELVVTNPTTGSSLAMPVLSGLIARMLSNAEAISKMGLEDATVLYVFAAVEALVQELARRRGIANGETSFLTLVGKIAYQGVIDHELLEELRQLYEKRNKIVHHGDATVRVPEEDFVGVLEKLRELLSEGEIAA